MRPHPILILLLSALSTGSAASAQGLADSNITTVLAAVEQHRAAGSLDRAVQALQSALAHGSRFSVHERVVLQNNLGRLYFDTGQWLDAENEFLRALAAANQVSDPGDPMILRVELNLASTLMASGQETKAESVVRGALTKGIAQGESGDVGRMLALLGVISRRRGDTVGAERLYQEAAAAFKGVPGKEARESQAILLANYAALCARTGRIAEAAARSEAALALVATLPSPTPVTALAVLRIAADVYAAQTHYDKAEQLLKRAVDLSEHALGSSHPARAGVLFDYAGVLRNLNRKREAGSVEKLARTAYTLSQRENFTGYTVEMRTLLEETHANTGATQFKHAPDPSAAGTARQKEN